jgi:hypothetical protein
MPTSGPPPTYAEDIKPLFTQMDRDHMLAKAGFDLWKFDDVKTWAARIYTTVQAGTMPPKGTEPEAPWPSEKIALFKAWIDGGCRP